MATMVSWWRFRFVARWRHFAHKCVLVLMIPISLEYTLFLNSGKEDLGVVDK